MARKSPPWIDVSVPVRHGMVHWPGNPSVELVRTADVAKGLDLSTVEPGDYEMICLPLRPVGADGAPARVLLRHRS